MKNPLITVVKYAFALGIAAYLLIAFIPRSYDVPALQNRTTASYWNLATGSKIAYNRLAAEGIQRPHPVIFLQGGPGGFISQRNIDALTPLTEFGYTIYLYDPIGSGLSDRLPNIEAYTADRHKKDLQEIIKHIGAEKVILIGQSWGAILATLFLAEHPEKVNKLILTGPGPIQPARPELQDIPSPDSLQLRKPAYTNKEAMEKSKNIRMVMVGFFAKSFDIKLATDREADAYQTQLNNELNKSIVCDITMAPKAESGGGFYAQLKTMQSLSEIQDPRPKLKRSNIPTLIMKGQCDNQAWGSVTEYLDLFPYSRLKIIPNAGHVISVEQPELYLKTILDFLNEEITSASVADNT